MAFDRAGFLVLLPAASFAALLLAVWWLELSFRTRGLSAVLSPASRAGDRAETGPVGREADHPGKSRAILSGFLFLMPALALLATLQLDNAFRLDTDDAPITFRYAENLATGHGFVYNDGERVLGTSAPLFTLALAALRVLGVPVETAGLLLSLAAVVAVMALLMRLGKLVAGPPGALFAAALVATDAPFLVYATQGMETVCFTALIIAALLCHLEGREKSAAALAALCAVMRLDGLSVAAALALARALERRHPSRAAVGLFALVVSPWFVFSFLYFGHVLPQSMLAKIHHTKQTDGLWMLQYLLFEQSLLFVPVGLLGVFRWCARRGAEPPAAAHHLESRLGQPSPVHGLAASEPSPSRRSAVPIWFILYVTAYTVVPIDAYPWYRIPLAPVLALLAAAGLVPLAEGWLRMWGGGWRSAHLEHAGGEVLTGASPRPEDIRDGRFPSPRRRRPTAALAALAAAAILWSVVRYVTYHDSLFLYAEQLRVRETPRVATASWLRDHAPTGSSVATSAIGHIGWVSGLRILDTSGLVSPELLRGFDIDRVRPAFIVGHDGDPKPGSVFKIDHPDYQLVQTLAVESDVVYRIYKRKDVQLH